MLPAGELNGPDGESMRRWNGELVRRVLAGLVLAIAAIAITVIGGLAFLLLWTGAAIWVWWEWAGVVKAEPRVMIGAIGSLAIVGMAVALAFDTPAIAILCAIIGTSVAGAIANAPRAWAGGGLLYASAALIPGVMLRSDPELGLAAMLWLYAVVWSADIAAYFCGRAIGGRKLVPAISPNKTWAGAVGGFAAGTAIGGVGVLATGVQWRIAHMLVAFVIVVAVQLGDLLESIVKRRFGAKNASQLIPGHGGLMDRLDGYIAGATVAVAIGLWRSGGNSAAAGLLTW